MVRYSFLKFPARKIFEDAPVSFFEVGAFGHGFVL
jgi:hypothetical protein